MLKKLHLLLICLALPSSACVASMVDTGQVRCYGESEEIDCIEAGSFHGQDAVYVSKAMAYHDNEDGTVTDLNTGLMWSKAVDTRKLSPSEASQKAAGMTLAGFSDWRVPSIKELYTLIDFRGYTGFSGRDMSSVPANAVPYINADYFDYKYGLVEQGERYIDAQWLSSTKYVATTMRENKTVFGVNFADGRIKGYGYTSRRGKTKKFYVRYVRGPRYGTNDFIDNGDGAIIDRSTDLMWAKDDTGPMKWKEALQFCEDADHAGYSDWRLPNAKELQYIVDYRRSPDTSDSPAIDPIFNTTAIQNEAGQTDYPYFWSSTTHLDGPRPGTNAVYVAFGRALGKLHGRVLDVHGAGAQRSDPKVGRPTSRGPQGDLIRINNYVRCVRGGHVVKRTNFPPLEIMSISVKKHETRPPHVDGFVERLDRDGDGRVSKYEFDGPPHAFDRADRDRDGYLTEDEAPRHPPPRR